MVIRIVVDRDGKLLAVEDLRPYELRKQSRGVVRVGLSTHRFVDAVNAEFPEVHVDVAKGSALR